MRWIWEKYIQCHNSLQQTLTHERIFLFKFIIITKGHYLQSCLQFTPISACTRTRGINNSHVCNLCAFVGQSSSSHVLRFLVFMGTKPIFKRNSKKIRKGKLHEPFILQRKHNLLKLQGEVIPTAILQRVGKDSSPPLKYQSMFPFPCEMIKVPKLSKYPYLGC